MFGRGFDDVADVVVFSESISTKIPFRFEREGGYVELDQVFQFRTPILDDRDGYQTLA